MFAQLAQRMVSAVGMLVVLGMQEVSSSSPLSSTGQKRKSNRSNSEYSSKNTATAAASAAVCVFGSGTSTARGCWQDTGFQALNRRCPACELGNSPASSVL